MQSIGTIWKAFQIAPFAQASVWGGAPQRSASGEPPARDPFAATLGSNAWAYGADVTRTGSAIVVANPHTYWRGHWLSMHQMHLTIPGQIDVAGADFAGLPLPLTGFNRDVAWTLEAPSTVTYYVLQSVAVQEGEHPTYLMEGKRKSLTLRPVAIDVRQADGRIVRERFTIAHSQLGPLYRLPKRSGSPEGWFAVTDAGEANAGGLNQLLHMARSRNFADFAEAIEKSRGLGAHFIAGDRTGEVAYMESGPLLDLTDAALEACRLPGAAFNVLDGGRRACSARSEAGAPLLLPAEKFPVLRGRGVIQNTNGSYRFSEYGRDVKGYSRMLGNPQAEPANLRLRMSQRRMTEITADATVSADEALQVVFDNRNFAAEAWLDSLLSICVPEQASGPLARGCAILTGWDRKNDSGSRGALLFGAFWERLEPLESLFAQPADAAKAVRCAAFGNDRCREGPHRRRAGRGGAVPGGAQAHRWRALGPDARGSQLGRPHRHAWRLRRSGAAQCGGRHESRQRRILGRGDGQRLPPTGAVGRRCGARPCAARARAIRRPRIAALRRPAGAVLAQAAREAAFHPGGDSCRCAAEDAETTRPLSPQRGGCGTMGPQPAVPKRGGTRHERDDHGFGEVGGMSTRIDRRSLLAGGAAAMALGATRGLWAASAKLDVAYINARLWAGPGTKPALGAVGTIGERIAAVCVDSVRAASGTGTRVVDLEGAFLMPGMTDCHTHFALGSLRLSQVALEGAATPEAFKQQIADAARALPKGEWLEGGGWDADRWNGDLPTREWIDASTPDTPVAVQRYDLHIVLLNSVAMKRVGIDRSTPDVPGGVILRDASGEPTGIFKDAAKELVLSRIPKPSPEQVDGAVRRGIALALSKGVTQVHCTEIDWLNFESIRRIRASGAPGLRFYVFNPLADWEKTAALVKKEGRGDHWFRWGGCKVVFDGSLGSRTALFYKPYLDEPTTRGIAVTQREDLRAWMGAADKTGLHVTAHAIGDEANDIVLDTMAEVVSANGQRDRRFRIEHAQHLSEAAIPRFAKQGVIASVQPYHAIDDGRWAARRIGPEALSRTYAFGALLRSGAHVCMGSDWPVALLDPLTGIKAAVLRETLDGKNPKGWFPEQRTTLEQALAGYTSEAAFAGFTEKSNGRIAPGFLADLVVLDRDLFAIDPETLTDAKVLRTIVGGEQRFGA